MEREILFRGKRIDDGEWFYGAYLTAHYSHFISNEDVFEDVYPETVGQFTGLFDRNGVGIFEGDLLKTTRFVRYNAALVVYSEGSFQVRNPDGVNMPLSRYVGGWKRDLAFGVEIIGNVHDNPEFLEGRAEL